MSHIPDYIRSAKFRGDKELLRAAARRGGIESGKTRRRAAEIRKAYEMRQQEEAAEMAAGRRDDLIPKDDR